MSRHVLDITDSQIALVSPTSIIQSPGAALANVIDQSKASTQLAFGQSVFEALKRRPLETRTDFWAQLSTTPLNTEFAGARHSADLVYEHLKFIFAEAERATESVDDLVIVSPPSLSQTQLELLLGILNAVGKAPSAILDRALLHQNEIGKAGVHLDLQWRQLVVTEVIVEDDQLIVGKSSAIPGNGYLDLLEQCLEHCADMCVEQTRFDPRRSADAEQLLFNAIPDALSTLTRSEEASLRVGGYDFKVSRAGLEFVGKRLMSAVEGMSGAISVDSLLAGLPGVRFDNTADPAALAQAAEQILTGLPPDEALARISSAKLKHPSNIGDVASKSETVQASQQFEGSVRAVEHVPERGADFAGPTHILINSRAYSILGQSNEAQGFGLIVEGDKVQVAEGFRSQVSVLSTESSHERLNAGCRLYRSDGTEALLIRVEG